MKKAKVFLTALTVLAVVGGALAFKTKIRGVFALCDTISGKCILNSFSSFATTTTFGGTSTYDVYGADCTTTMQEGPLTCVTITRPSS